MRVLDRASFTKRIPLSAVRIGHPHLISVLRAELDRTGILLLRDRLKPLRPDPDQAVAARGGKCMLLTPEIKHDGERLDDCPHHANWNQDGSSPF